MKKKPVLVSQYKAKLLLNCDDRYLARCREQGMPYLREKGQYKYDMELVHAWFGGKT